MLPPIVTKSFDLITLSVIGFTIIMVAGTFVAMLLAHSFGGKSQVKRHPIFSIVSFVAYMRQLIMQCLNSAVVDNCTLYLTTLPKACNNYSVTSLKNQLSAI